MNRTLRTGLATLASLGAGLGLALVNSPAASADETPAPTPVYRCDGVVATIVGTDGADTLTGTPARDVIVGLGGNDTITGMGGNDLICAGAGDDVVTTGAGSDRVFGGSGRDVIRGGEGRDKLFGGSGNDHLVGGAGRDRIFGESGRDLIEGGANLDRLFGGSGGDIVRQTAASATVQAAWYAAFGPVPVTPPTAGWRRAADRYSTARSRARQPIRNSARTAAVTSTKVGSAVPPLTRRSTTPPIVVISHTVIPCTHHAPRRQLATSEPTVVAITNGHAVAPSCERSSPWLNRPMAVNTNTSTMS